MFSWYEDLVFEGRNRAIINAVISALFVGVLLVLAFIPTTFFESLIDDNPARMEYLEYFRQYRIVPVLTIIGAFILFMGFDVLRDEILDDALGYTRIACIVIGIVLVVMPTLTGNALSCGDFVYDNLGELDIISAAFRALPRFGFFYGAFCLAYYAYVGITDEWDSFLDKISPIFPIIAAPIGFLISFGFSALAIK